MWVNKRRVPTGSLYKHQEVAGSSYRAEFGNKQEQAEAPLHQIYFQGTKTASKNDIEITKIQPQGAVLPRKSNVHN